jgi:hypothetical protein
MQIMRVILSHTFDAKSGGLLLYALQTVSLNLRHTDLEPIIRERVVIDPGAVARDVEDLEDQELDEEDADPEDCSEEARAGDDDEDEDKDDNEEPGGDDDEDEEEDDDDEDEPPLYVEDGALRSGTRAFDAAPTVGAIPPPCPPGALA